MIVLDTNVLSALMQDTPDPAVVEWLDNQPTESICDTILVRSRNQLSPIWGVDPGWRPGGGNLWRSRGPGGDTAGTRS